VATAYLDEALAGFSGYIAADELYDGPYCVLSIVDNRKFRRLTYQVLDHNPTHEDILRFFGDFKKELDRRGLVLQGITTDGSPLYPVPIHQVFGEVPHQICEFHVIKELTLAILRAVAQARKRLKASMPTLGRGRPSRKTNKIARRRKRLERKIADLFDRRHLFVKHHLTPSEKRTLRRITRGLPELRRLREIMEEVYRLFDRRCRTDTALEKLARLRRRVRRFKSVSRTLNKLFSENLDKALMFLDDSLLPSTSNAVERGNRRHRKMQKTVYRVRTQSQISRRIAADMQREAQAIGRIQTTQTLHHHRHQCPKARYRCYRLEKQPCFYDPSALSEDRALVGLERPPAQRAKDCVEFTRQPRGSAPARVSNRPNRRWAESRNCGRPAAAARG
jgi:hypothetical protein